MSKRVHVQTNSNASLTSLSRNSDRSASSNHAAVDDFDELPGDGLVTFVDGVGDSWTPFPPLRTGVDPVADADADADALNELDRCKMDGGGK